MIHSQTVIMLLMHDARHVHGASPRVLQELEEQARPGTPLNVSTARELLDRLDAFLYWLRSQRAFAREELKQLIIEAQHQVRAEMLSLEDLQRLRLQADKDAVPLFRHPVMPPDQGPL